MKRLNEARKQELYRVCVVVGCGGCGVMWCGVVWCDGCGVVSCGLVWCGGCCGCGVV